jgi:O-phospho-L-seryl-tRNASec:L-selenocysteinyl-tRNA synthase
VGKGYANIS